MAGLGLTMGARCRSNEVCRQGVARSALCVRLELRGSLRRVLGLLPIDLCLAWVAVCVCRKRESRAGEESERCERFDVQSHAFTHSPERIRGVRLPFLIPSRSILSEPIIQSIWIRESLTPRSRSCSGVRPSMSTMHLV